VKSKWLDCGHEENYFEVKSQLINSRFFNSLTINSFGCMEKSSGEKEKLQQEVFFNQNLPEELSYLVPRTNDLVEGEEHVRYSMEYYPFPNLAEIVLYWDLKDCVFENLFHTIELILKKFNSFDYSLSKKEYCQFYIVKLNDRLKSFYNQNKSLSLMSEEIYINGIRCLSPQQLMPWITQNIHDLYDETHLGIMHGDLCFNNILYDFSNDVIKLIDPRGKFAEEMSIYGDMKYDLAKIIHSSVYHYDYIVNDLYELSISVNTGYTYKFALRDNDLLLQKLSIKLVKSLGVDFQQIEFMVGMLFLSMAALHKDDENRQVLMYLHGVKILNENYNGEKENLS
ncbi:MAG: hypothetical protein R3321_14910, partial [Nitrososphaeraceae archaeon]|nr:hypothetical protein [Nitrososphaeraceae archaeon]